eukprot:SAG31_NODE_3928_length_3745_cov_1.460505_2_plen_88_part_00
MLQHNYSYPRFGLLNMPYDGLWTVRFNGDSAGYSELYGDTCMQPEQEVVDVSVINGSGSVCVPPMSMLVLSRTSEIEGSNSVVWNYP